jgi:hypothetical protein
VTRVNLKIASPHYYLGQARRDLSGHAGERRIFN